MPNTYSQVYLQIVFAVKHRQNLIPKENREQLHRYITGVVSKRKQKMLCIFAMPDHVHLLVGIEPSVCISNLVRDVKAASSKYITDHNWVKGRFRWQEGFGVFSYSKSHLDVVYKYIKNQEKHHEKRSFKDEYLNLLEKFEVDYDEKYLFDWLD